MGEKILAELKSDYLIHGVELSVFCDHAPTNERLHEYLSAYRAPVNAASPKGRVQARISFGSVAYPVPLHAPRMLRYGPLRSYFLDGRTYFTDYFSTLVVEPDGTCFHGNLSPDTADDFGKDFFVTLFFTLSMFETFRFHGLYFVHAAALQGPDGTGYMIIGNAGSGKTSLTMSLIDQGFKFLADDTVFLSLGEDKDVHVMGFAREFHVAKDFIDEKESFKKFSKLPDLSIADSKKSLKPDDWFCGQKLDTFKNPRVILFPGIGAKATKIEPLAAGAALTRLLPQSPFVLAHPATAPDHLEALKRVLYHGHAFSLDSGPELKADPELVRKTVETARDMANENALIGGVNE